MSKGQGNRRKKGGKKVSIPLLLNRKRKGKLRPSERGTRENSKKKDAMLALPLLERGGKKMNALFGRGSLGVQKKKKKEKKKDYLSVMVGGRGEGGKKGRAKKTANF